MYHIEASVFSTSYLSLMYVLGAYDLRTLGFFIIHYLTEFRYIWEAAERDSPTA